MKRLDAIWQKRKILQILIKRDLRVRYGRSILGYLWTIIDPLALSLTYFLLFVIIFQRKDAGHQPYFLYLITGMLPWQWFNAATTESMRALMAEAKLVKSTNLPRELWVIRLVCAKGIEFMLSIPVLLTFVAVYMIKKEAQLDWDLVYFPLGVVLEFVLLLGVGFLLAPLTVLVVDVQPLVRIFLRLYFYMCPVVYTLQLVTGPRIPEGLRVLFHFNPLSGILELYRAGFFHTQILWTSVIESVIEVLATLVFGWWVFAKLEKPVLKEI